MVQLKDLVERFFSDFTDALTITPFIEGFSLHITRLNSLLVRKQDKGGAQELVLGSTVEVDAR
jgi:hypothetical protein